MKLLSAILDEDRADLHLSIHTDDAALIPDPEWVRPTKEIEEVDPSIAFPSLVGDLQLPLVKRTVPDMDAVHPLIPDPAAIRTVTYGDQPRQSGETRAAYRNRLDRLVKGALREERLMIRAEQRRTRKPDDLATDPTVTGVTALVSAPVDLDTATLTVP